MNGPIPQASFLSVALASCMLLCGASTLSCSSSTTPPATDAGNTAADTGATPEVDSGTPAGDSGGTTPAATIAASNFMFAPATVTVKVGDTVRWTFNGFHNVVSGAECMGDGKFTSGLPMAVTTFDHTFTEAGTFPYFCQPHCSSGMKGTVTVTP